MKESDPKNGIISARRMMLYLLLAIVVLSVISSAVYIISGTITDPVDAFFESVSGFTTTGLSVLDPVSIPDGMRIFRGACQWLGGCVSLCLIAFLLSAPKGNALEEASFYRAGISFKASLRRVFTVYLILTVALCALLAVSGLDIANCIFVAMSTVSTGGFSPGPVLSSGLSETFILLFMLLTAVSYPMYYYAAKGRSDKFEKNTEIMALLGIVICASIIVSGTLAITKTYGIRESFELGCFQTLSNLSTTGYVLDDVTKWPTFARTILALLSFIGGSSFSLTSGLKIARLIVIVRILSRSFVVRIHPKAVISTKLDGKQVPRSSASQMSTFLLMFFGAYIIGSFVISFEAPDLLSSLSLCASTLTNTGNSLYMSTSLGGFSIFMQLFLCVIMLIGRLELYALLLAFRNN